MGVITGAVISITTRRKPSGTPVTIGRAMALSVQEQYRVVPVYGIGSLTARELPVLQYAGAFTMQQFAFSDTALRNLMDDFDRRTASQSVESFVNQLLFNQGIDVTISYKGTAPTTSAPNPPATGLMMITGAVCQTESMTIQENSIVLRDGSFIFAEPIQTDAGAPAAA